MAKIRDSSGVRESTKVNKKRKKKDVVNKETTEEEAPVEEASHVEETTDLVEEEEDLETEEDDGKQEQTTDEVDLDDVDSQPLQPEKMYFSPSEYSKSCKIGTRCSVKNTVDYLLKFREEMKWFRNHDQFKHVFHMPKDPNHMLQGMWMLLVRTVCSDMEKECWFVVNGVPVRYSLREHALLSGFSCQEYPDNWEELGDEKFAKRVFGAKWKATKVKDVEGKLDGIKHKTAVDRMKLCILYFLCKVLKAKSKSNGNIDPFLLRIVDDVHACETFPWGRYTFNDCIDGIRSVMKNMNGSVKPNAQIGFPGFIVPLEVIGTTGTNVFLN